MPITSAAELVQALSEFHLLEQGQLDKIAATLPGRATDPRVLARELVQQGWLTTFQVNRLFQGRGQELVLGPYLLLEPLGEGGMGQVFKARHQLMNRTVALKVIRNDRLANLDAVQRFYREIRLVAQLDHPHLIRAHDAAQVGATHFLVMEFAEGTDLQKLVKKSGPLPVDQACAYIRQAALGLQHVAEHGMVHRDIKPSNIQATAEGRTIKILDLGLARLQTDDGIKGGRNDLTQTCAVMGTPDYIAPEQIADPRGVDIRADIYSLGCTFYFLLAGQPPFPNVAWEEKLVNHRKAEPQPIEQLRPEVVPALGAVLRKMMAKQPADRYPVPSAVADALAPFCQLPAPVAVAVAAGGPQAAATASGHTPNAPPSLLPSASPHYEPGWTLPLDETINPAQAAKGAVLNVATVLPPAQGPTASYTDQTTLQPLAEATVLAPARPTATAPPARRGLFLMMIAVAALLALGTVLAGGAVVVAILLMRPASTKDIQTNSHDKTTEVTKDKTTEVKQPPKPVGPVVLVDEDFTTAAKKGLPLPEGWTGDGLRVVTIKDRAALEVSKQGGGAEVVKVPLRQPLKGNFSISGDYAQMAYFKMIGVILEDSKSGAVLPIAIHSNATVTIVKDNYDSLPGFVLFQPAQFRIQRTGTKVTVALDGKIVAVKDFKDAPDYDKLSLSLTPGQTTLFKLKVENLAP